MPFLRELTRLAAIALTISLAWWLIATAPEDGRMHLASWLEGRSPHCVVRVDWSRDGATLFTHTRGELDPVRSLQVHAPALPAESRAIRHEDEMLWSGRLLPEARSVLATGRYSGLWRHDLSTGEHRTLREFAPGEYVGATVPAPDEMRLALVLGSRIVILDARSGDELAAWDGGDGGLVDLDWSDDGAWIAAASSTGHLHLWDAATGNLRRTWTGHAGAATRVAFAAHRRLASVGMDGQLRLWSIESGEEQWSALADPFGVLSLAVSADGRQAATGGLNGEVNLWDLSRFHRTATLDRQPRTVNALAFHPDGRQLASGGSDGLVRLWDLESAAPVTTFAIR